MFATAIPNPWATWRKYSRDLLPSFQHRRHWIGGLINPSTFDFWTHNSSGLLGQTKERPGAFPFVFMKVTLISLSLQSIVVIFPT